PVPPRRADLGLDGRTFVLVNRQSTRRAAAPGGAPRGCQEIGTARRPRSRRGERSMSPTGVAVDPGERGSTGFGVFDDPTDGAEPDRVPTRVCQRAPVID